MTDPDQYEIILEEETPKRSYYVWEITVKVRSRMLVRFRWTKHLAPAEASYPYWVDVDVWQEASTFAGSGGEWVRLYSYKRPVKPELVESWHSDGDIHSNKEHDFAEALDTTLKMLARTY